MSFTSADQVKEHFASNYDPNQFWIRPHHSASYIWEVKHHSFGPHPYGFSNEVNLLEWANNNLVDFFDELSEFEESIDTE